MGRAAEVNAPALPSSLRASLLLLFLCLFPLLFSFLFHFIIIVVIVIFSPPSGALCPRFWPPLQVQGCFSFQALPKEFSFPLLRARGRRGGRAGGCVWGGAQREGGDAARKCWNLNPGAPRGHLQHPSGPLRLLSPRCRSYPLHVRAPPRAPPVPIVSVSRALQGICRGVE